jgi:predicted nucleic acid-binding protein
MADSLRFIELLSNNAIFVSDLFFSNSETISVARSNNLTSYDTSYLLLAMKTGCDISSKDKSLIKACINNGVSIFNKL